MSREINNREYRQGVLRDLIAQLHDGRTVEEVKGRFEEVFGGVSAQEIAQAEQALIEGGVPVTEVQRLCDVHAAVFKGSIEEIHASVDPSAIPGHPADVLKRENRAIEKLLGEIRALATALPGARDALAAKFAALSEIDKHYSKKENLMFPYLEQYGITAPPKVMWGVDDEIRGEIKSIRATLDSADAAQLRGAIEGIVQKIADMIFKEESILLPMLAEHLTADEWARIAGDTAEIGYCLIDAPPAWTGETGVADDLPAQATPGEIVLPTGKLTVQELTRMLDTLPFDITFVGKDDTVRYFSQGPERVFPRTKTVIGRQVSNCHPPASVHIVEKIVEDFKTGRKDHEDFWIPMGDKFILIRYFAVRDEAGAYLGVLEVTQNIRPIQAIAGEKRLVSD
ncbi:MAG: DUF438 domain-containing protein [Christensenellales bacterium]|jgi:DUF438 domain-containing protein